METAETQVGQRVPTEFVELSDLSGAELAAAQENWDRVTARIGLPRSDVRTTKVLDPLPLGQRIKHWRYSYQTLGALALAARTLAFGETAYLLESHFRGAPAPAPASATSTALCDGVREWCAPRTGTAQNIVLPDTSSLTLQPGGSITFARVRDGAYDRAAVLRGDMTIAVNGAPDRWFAIFTPRARIDLAPGRYAIKAAQDEVWIRVEGTEGEARIEGDPRTYGDGRVLHPNESARIRDRYLDVNP